jgi:cell filamentation protein
MAKSGPDVVHYPVGDPAAPQVPYQYDPAGPALGEAAEEQYRRLSAKNLVRGLDRDTFVTEAAETWGELNTSGSALPGGEGFCAARFYSQATGSNERLTGVLAREIVPSDQRRTLEGRRAATRRQLGAEIERRGPNSTRRWTTCARATR